MKKAVAYVLARWVAIAAAVAVVIIAGIAYAFYIRNSGEEVLLTVTPKEFVQEVSLSGRVEPGKDVDLSFAAGGRIARVLVSVGTKVRSGELIAELENADIVALVEQRTAVVEAEQATLAGLKAGARPEEIAVAEAEVTAALAAKRQAAQAVVDTLRDAYDVADNAVRVQTDQFISNPTGSTPTLNFSVYDSTAKTAVEVGRREMESMLVAWSPLVSALTADSQLDVALTLSATNLTAVSKYLAAVNAALNASIPTGSVTQATLTSYANTVGTARATVNAAISAQTTSATAYIAAVNTFANAEKSLTLTKASATADDIAGQEARVKAARASVNDALAQLQKTRITAPFAGVVTVLNAKAGATALAGTSVLSLETDGDFSIESFVPEINVALLTPGNRARVMLDAYGEDVEFATTLVSIDPAETIRDGVSTYRTIFTFDAVDARIRPGMTASMTVTTDRRSGVLQVPQKVVTGEPGQKTVMVKRNGVYETVPVTTGAVASSGDVEIVSGLTAGDVVVIVPRTP